MIRSSAVGLAEGDGDPDGLAEAAGLPGGMVGGGVCASALIAMKKLMKDSDVN